MCPPSRRAGSGSQQCRDMLATALGYGRTADSECATRSGAGAADSVYPGAPRWGGRTLIGRCDVRLAGTLAAPTAIKPVITPTNDGRCLHCGPAAAERPRRPRPRAEPPQADTHKNCLLSARSYQTCTELDHYREEGKGGSSAVAARLPG